MGRGAIPAPRHQWLTAPPASTELEIAPFEAEPEVSSDVDDDGLVVELAAGTAAAELTPLVAVVDVCADCVALATVLAAPCAVPAT